MIRDITLTGNGRLRPVARRAPADLSMALPRYELRAHYFGPGDTEMEVWQLPSPATPKITAPVRVAGLSRRNLELVEHRVTRRLKQAGVPFESPALRLPRAWQLSEDIALTLGLLFRALAPMRSRDNLRAVVEGIEAMGKEEAAYWLGMAMHRKNPRRVLSALRILLTSPRRPAVPFNK
ncbi:MAG: hypothetical protein AAB466_07450 [Verrucomicrobiota bacterium]